MTKALATLLMAGLPGALLLAALDIITTGQGILIGCLSLIIGFVVFVADL